MNRKINDRAGEQVEAAAGAVIVEQGRECADCDADCGEQHRRRQLQSSRERLNQADYDQQASEQEQSSMQFHGVGSRSRNERMLSG